MAHSLCNRADTFSCLDCRRQPGDCHKCHFNRLSQSLSWRRSFMESRKVRAGEFARRESVALSNGISRISKSSFMTYLTR